MSLGLAVISVLLAATAINSGHNVAVENISPICARAIATVFDDRKWGEYSDEMRQLHERYIYIYDEIECGRLDDYLYVGFSRQSAFSRGGAVTVLLDMNAISVVGFRVVR